MKSTEPFTEKRPWGEFRQYTSGVPVTVKTIFVKKGERLSLQKHAKRSEFWKILQGNPDVTIGDRIISAHVGDELEIAIGELHRISAPSDDVLFFEIGKGEFDENDIIRTEDNYGRA